MFTISLIDKHPITRLGIGSFIKDGISNINIEDSSTLFEYRTRFSRSKPKVIIIGLANESIIECLDIVNLCNRYYSSSFLVMYGEPHDSQSIATFMKYGVKGYLLKGDDPSDLLKCLKTVSKGKIYLSETVSEGVYNHLTHSFANKYGNRKSFLTNREHDVAGHLCKGMSTSEIASLLNLKCSTVSTIKSNLFRKMNVTSVIELFNQYNRLLNSTNMYSFPSLSN